MSVKKNITYNPWAIREAKRKAEEAKKAEGLAKISIKKDAASDEATETAQATPLMQAEKFLKAARGGVTEILDVHGELVKFNQAALNSNLDDLDRKKIHAQFAICRTKLDELSQREFESVKIFSGEFSEAGKKLILNSEKDEFLVVRMDDMSSRGLKVDRLKVDSLVNARKAVQDLEEAKRTIEQSIASIISKFQVIEFHKKKAEAAKPESEKKKEDAGEVSPDGGFELKGWKKAFYNDLKRRQQSAADRTGLERGLLIKLTG